MSPSPSANSSSKFTSHIHYKKARFLTFVPSSKPVLVVATTN